jgi:hypothetical protein
MCMVSLKKFFFFFWTQGLALSALPLDPHLQPFFALVILETRSHYLLRPAWITNLYTPCCSRNDSTCHHTQLFFPLRWGLTIFFFAPVGLKPQSSWSQPPMQLKMTGAPHCTQLLVKMEVSWTFCLGWPQTAFLLSSTSQIGSITWVSHLHPAKNLDFKGLGCRSVVEYLPSMHKALGSTSNTEKKKKI